MAPGIFYKERIDDLQKDLKKLQQRKSGFGWLRFGSIAAIIVAFYVLWSLSVWYVIIVSILLLVVFIRLLFADLKNKAAIERTIHLTNINNDELKFLDGNYLQTICMQTIWIFLEQILFSNISTEPLQKWEAGSWPHIYKLLQAKKL